MAFGFGSAKFTYTDGTSETHNLTIPLQKVIPSVRFGMKRTRESLDLANHETWWTGTAYEVVAQIRYDDAPQSLIDLLLAGGKGITITYDDGDGNTVSCKLVAPGEEVITPDFDEDQEAFDEHVIEIRLRKTDGSAFGGWIF